MFKYCPRCGTKLVEKEISHQPRMVCPHCHYIHWSNETISVGGIVVDHHKILLVQRGQEPGRGLWTNPGGYVEQGEEIKDAIVREIKEETGLLTHPTSLALVADAPGHHEHNVFINFRLSLLGGQLKVQHSELMDAGFFSLQELHQLKVADLTKDLINLLVKEHSAARGLNKADLPISQTNGFYLYR